MSDIEEMLKTLLSSADEKNKSDNDNVNESDNTHTSEDDEGIFNGIDIEKIMKIGELMAKMNEHDKNTDLLIAVKPHLKEENRAKIDTAVRLFRIISLLPYLRESGLLDNLF